MRIYLFLFFAAFYASNSIAQPYILSKYAVEFLDKDNKIRYRHQNDTVYNSIETLPSNTHLIFPKDIHIDACSGSFATPESKVTQRWGCFMMQYQKDEVLKGGGACQKILRKFTVVDWCYLFGPNDKITEKTYESASSWMDFGEGTTDPDGAGPIMKLADWAGIVPTPVAKFPKSLENHWVLAKRIYGTNKVGTKEFPYGYGLWEHTQIIKIGDNTPPVIKSIEFATVGANGSTLCKDAEICVNDCNPQNFAFFAQATDNCIKNDNNLVWDWTITTEKGEKLKSDKQIFSTSPLPYGKNLVNLAVQDGCGNFVSCSFYLTVKSCRKPTPIAKTMLSTTVGDMEMARIDAKLIDNFSYSCSNELVFRVQKIGRLKSGFPKNTKSEAQKIKTFAEALSLPTFLNVDCTDAACGFIYANFYVIDTKNNTFDYVTVYISVWQNNPNLCKGAKCSDQKSVSALPQTTVTTSSNKQISDFYVEINGNTIETVEAYQQMLIDLNKNGETAEIAIQKQDNILNGVSQSDALRLLQHIKGTRKFTSPYQYLAADVNRSGSVNYADYAELSQIVAKQKSAFDHAQTWVFMDKNQNLTTTNVFASPLKEKVVVQNSVEAINFIGIKLGDIDGDVAVATNLNIENPTNISSQKFDNQSINTLSVYPNPFSDNFQLSFNIEKAENVSIRLFDLNGKLISEKTQFFEIGNNTFNFETQKFHSGMYIITVNSENMGIMVEKVAKF